MDFKVVRNIVSFFLIVGFFLWLFAPKRDYTTTVKYKGQEFIIYSMTVEGRTRHGCKIQHKHGVYCPKDLVVYSPVFVEKEAYDLEKWKKRYDTSPTDKQSK